MQTHTSISEEDLKRYRALFVRSIWRQIYESYERRKAQGLTQKDLAERLGVNKSVISRRLNGTCNFTIEILSDMARALDTKPEVTFIPYEQLTPNKEPHNYRVTAITAAATPETVGCLFSTGNQPLLQQVSSASSGLSVYLPPTQDRQRGIPT